MKHLVKSSLAIFISSSLVACGGTKGSFGVDDVQIPKTEINKGNSKDITTNREQEAAAEGIMKPSLGYEIAIPRRNWHPKAVEEEAALSAENLKAITESSTDIPHLDEVKKEGGYAVYTHNPNGKLTQQRDLEYVRTGYVYTLKNEIIFKENIAKSGAKGYIYYRGISPSSAIPTAPTVTYQGTWDFISNAKNGRTLPGEFSNSASGNRYGAGSFDESVYNGEQNNPEFKVGHTSEFTADFANKKLKGNLYKNHSVNSQGKQMVTHRYEVAADISGNRFKGTATAKDPNSQIFGKNSKYLEGGFFGPNSEELAGKFLADDNSLFVVFGAKRNKQGNESVEKVFDTVKINLKDFSAMPIDNFGNATKLFIDGVEYSLLPENGNFVTLKTFNVEKNIKGTVCCSNLDYLKFGTLGIKEQANLFLQGDRTALKEMPTTGEARYKGTWDAYISDSAVWTTSASNKIGGSQAQFEVDFGTKQVRGELTAENRVNPSVLIFGSIAQNGFTGKASTVKEGLNIDPENTSNTKIVHFQDVNVTGGFYGKDAAEIGGAFYSPDKKVGAVFGAKRQVNE